MSLQSVILRGCQLCHFDIAPGDEIQVGTTRVYRRLRWNPEDTHDQPFRRKRTRESADSETNLPTFGCECYHVGCLDVTGLTDRVSLMLLYAMRYGHRPSPLQKEFRRRHLLTRLSTRLLEHFALQGSHLPLELWHKVAEHLLPQYAAANAHSLLWKRHQTDAIRLTEDVWCKYIEFEGIRYVARLSNTPFDGWELAHRPSGETIQCVLTKEDHFGVLGVVFSAMPNPPPVEEAPGIWWRKARIKDAHARLSVGGIGLKFRFRNSDHATRDDIACNVPLPDGVRFEYLTKPLDVPCYMSSLVCNQPSITGYSILQTHSARRGHFLSTIYAHRGMQDWRCYQSAITTGSWLHMPVDPGEVITEIWERHRGLGTKSALGFKTNLGRVFVAGIHCARSYLNPTCWSLLARPGQSRVFFQDSAHGIGKLAFEDPPPMGPSLPFSPSSPSVKLPVCSLGDHFFSNHCLTGLVRVTPCKVGDRPGFTGMLLHYSNGHRESVGQVRLDCLCPPISLQDCPSWYLALKVVDGGGFYLAAVMTTAPNHDSGFDKVVQLFHEGSLEWFWSSMDCHVLYRYNRTE
ncbi:hypothetical protein M440DRAFT_1399844 [Trichoderma longibrachiatum ATCC 18648]|uniref:Uncharacterized protein n=1 Tax=Trichoderma longibrachiatum ATCC 18648 TaxID=983965 RepID=A0A2T4CAY8_TRILO|nr:hypothetical protein M440DRAFT_1399844 [Trichoderma longibrachiatum ATCC 18648]